MKYLSFASSITCLLVFFVAGCGEQAPSSPEPQPAPAAKSADAKHGHEHGDHKAGPHDGTVSDWGGGKYHVEFTVDHDKKTATVYILGSDEKTATPIMADQVLLSINEPKFQIELMPVPLEGETDGLASRFVGQHDSLGIVQKFAGTISGEVDGTPYAGDFEEEPHDEHEHK
ncbi:MAG: hypothetical protein ACKVT0_01380 [Planctomycetaceae bacterium]